MNKQITLFIFCAFVGCAYVMDSKFVRKEVVNEDICVRWYYYSYISGNSPEIVEVERNDTIKEILRKDRHIVDINMSRDSIIISVVRPSKRYILSDTIVKEIFGYKVILDTTAMEMQEIPKGVRYH